MDSSRDGFPVPSIIGAVVGGFVAILFLLLSAALLRRYLRMRRHGNTEQKTRCVGWIWLPKFRLGRLREDHAVTPLGLPSPSVDPTQAAESTSAENVEKRDNTEPSTSGTPNNAPMIPGWSMVPGDIHEAEILVDRMEAIVSAYRQVGIEPSRPPPSYVSD
jgi:hypothetical protein